MKKKITALPEPLKNPPGIQGKIIFTLNEKDIGVAYKVAEYIKSDLSKHIINSLKIAAQTSAS